MYLSDILLILLDPLVDQNLKTYIFLFLELDSMVLIHFFLELLLELLDIISMIFNISLKAPELQITTLPKCLQLHGQEFRKSSLYWSKMLILLHITTGRSKGGHLRIVHIPGYIPTLSFLSPSRAPSLRTIQIRP